MPNNPTTSPSSPSPVTGELLGPHDDQKERSGIQNERLAKLLSYWTDSVFEVPGLGWRFGLDPIIGLVPIVGDLATSAVALYILSLAAHLQVPRSTLTRMTVNVAIDYVVGSVPLLGNVFDFAWRANDRNMQLLERALAMPIHERRQQTFWDWLIIGSLIAVLVAVFVGSVVLAIWLAAWIGQQFRSLG